MKSADGRCFRTVNPRGKLTKTQYRRRYYSGKKSKLSLRKQLKVIQSSPWIREDPTDKKITYLYSSGAANRYAHRYGKRRDGTESCKYGIFDIPYNGFTRVASRDFFILVAESGRWLEALAGRYNFPYLEKIPYHGYNLCTI